LTLRADGRVHVQDLATRNGVRVDGQPIDPEGGRIVTDGELRVGRTRLRLRTAEVPLAPERPFRRDFLRRHRTVLAIAGLLLCAAFAAFLQWSQAPEQLAARMLIAELVALAIAAICVGLWAWGYWLYGMAAFALQWRWLDAAMVMLAGVVALLATWLHLRHATRFGRVPSVMLAVLATLLCYGVWWLVELQVDPRTVNRVQLGAPIYPPSLRVAPSMDAADYFADAVELKREANRNRQQSLLENPILDVED
jgi:hypothetical protein